MPKYESSIRSTGNYCVITIYRDDLNRNELIKYLKESGWVLNETVGSIKPRGFIKPYNRENKQWALAFCENPQKHMELTKKEAERKKREEEKKYGKKWSAYSESELRDIIDKVLKTRSDYREYVYAGKFLNFCQQKDKEIRFIGMKFEDNGCVLRFWISEPIFHPFKLEYLICNNYRIRTKKMYNALEEKESYHYTSDRNGSVYDFYISEEKGLPYESVGHLEMIFGVYDWHELAFYTKKMILDYDEYEEYFSLCMDEDNEFEPENLRTAINVSVNNGGNNYEYYDSDMNVSEWSVESYLMRMGYSVAKNRGLSEKERQHILEQVLRSKKMNKWEIIEHIERQINLRKYNSDYDLAISKWEKDLAFVRNCKL